MKNVNFEYITITDGFWKQKQELIRSTTIYSVYNRFSDSGRVKALDCDPNCTVKPHHFWDSDLAKWVESVAYLTAQKKDEQLEKLADDIIDKIEKKQREDGYFNSYFLTVAPQDIFTQRTMHELYCAGHLIEAAIAYKRATGKDKLYRCMLRFADEIDRVFRIEKSAAFFTPGHQELELALMKLWKESGNSNYLELAKYFIENRGLEQEKGAIRPDHLYGYAQDHAPVRQQTAAIGHAVRLLYMYSGVADLAYETKDEGLKKVCEDIFCDITEKKMYITGGIGSNSNNEGFDKEYYLPNETAYNETCASIAMCFFALRMQLLSNQSKYADVIEKEIYNGMMSGLSLDGKAFFYENPLEIDLSDGNKIPGEMQKIHYPIRQRKELFDCSCCPPNITRLIPSIANFIYTEEKNEIRVNQYVDSEATFDGFRIVQKTGYPFDENVTISFNGKATVVGFRIPCWCNKWNMTVNGMQAEGTELYGYYYVPLKDGDKVFLHFDMPVVLMQSAREVKENAGKVVVMRGPIVYCAESVDNPDFPLWDFKIDHPASTDGYSDELKLPVIEIDGTIHPDKPAKDLYQPYLEERVCAKLRMIPYFAFANRGESNMQVWFQKG